VGRPEGNRSLIHGGVDWRMLLKWILKKWDESIDWIYLAYECINEPLNLIIF
jgi:hypothetical protein